MTSSGASTARVSLESPALARGGITASHLLVWGAGALMVALVVLHVPGVNGPDYWQWHWRSLPIAQQIQTACVLAVPLMLLLVTCAKFDRGEWDTRFSLVLLSVVCFVGQVLTAGMRTGQFTFRDMASRVQDVAHTYHGAAVDVVQRPGWLAQYHELVPTFDIHAAVHPPGPVAYHLGLIHLFENPGQAAVVALPILWALSAFIPVMVFALSRALGVSAQPSFYAAAMSAILPGVWAFNYGFDPLWVVLATATLAVWVMALRRDRWTLSVAFGFMLALCLLSTYKLAVLGVSVVGLMGVVWLYRRETRLLLMAKHCAIALATVATTYGLLFVATGYQPIASFAASVEYQNEVMLSYLGRELPWTISWDLWDFMLGMGWLPAVVLVMAVGSDIRQRQWTLASAIAAVAVAQPVVVACTGLIQAETARCWLFMAPLVLIAGSRVLAEWTGAQRLATFALLWTIVVALRLNMVF